MKYLMLLRHAKSDWHSGATTDHARPLNKRGKRDADQLGKYCQQEVFNKTVNKINVPDQIICSTAQRSRQTWSRINSHLQVPERHIQYNDKLYGISALALLRYIQSSDASKQSLLLLGHNPALEQIFLQLIPEAPQQSNGKIFTTTNLAILEVQGGWSTLSKDTSQLHTLIRPKEIA